jgi:hypothetical protein
MVVGTVTGPAFMVLVVVLVLVLEKFEKETILSLAPSAFSRQPHFIHSPYTVRLLPYAILFKTPIF